MTTEAPSGEPCEFCGEPGLRVPVPVPPLHPVDAMTLPERPEMTYAVACRAHIRMVTLRAQPHLDPDDFERRTK